MPPLLWIRFRDGLKDLTWGWLLLVLVTMSAWALTFLVERSCSLIRIEVSSSSGGGSSMVDGSTTTPLPSFGRGATRGRLDPGDECRPWGHYGNRLEFDIPLSLASIAAPLSVVLGAFLVGYLWISVCCQPFPRFFKPLLVPVVCMITAGLQATTQLLVRSHQLCENVMITTITGRGETVTYDTCSSETVAYRATFASIGLWSLAGLLFPTVRLHRVMFDNEEDNRQRFQMPFAFGLQPERGEGS